MFNSLNNTIHGVVDFTWPMIFISLVVLILLRVCYLIKKHDKCIIYKELLSLSFIIYILCLFQVVTFQDNVSWATNNFIPFKEIFRYDINSRLFLKNVIGNMIMFLPFGYFVSYFLENRKAWLTLFITIVVSISIEFVQLAIGRVFDVDDIILNVFGGFFGWLVYYIIIRIGDRLPKVFKSEWFLNVLSILVLLGVIVLL